MHPWFALLMDKDSEEVRKVLVERFQNIRHPALKRFRDYILDSEVRGLVCGYKGLFLWLWKNYSDSDGEAEEQDWLLAAPLAEEEVHKRVKEWKLPEEELLTEFHG